MSLRGSQRLTELYIDSRVSHLFLWFSFLLNVRCGALLFPCWCVVINGAQAAVTGNLSNVKLITCNLTASGKLSMYFMLSCYSPFSMLALAWSVVRLCALVAEMWSLLETRLFEVEHRMPPDRYYTVILLERKLVILSFWKEKGLFLVPHLLPIENKKSSPVLPEHMLFACVVNVITVTHCEPLALKTMAGNNSAVPRLCVNYHTKQPGTECQ